MPDLTTYSSSGLDVYFQSQRAHIDGQLTKRLVEFIGGTQSSLDVAIYDLRDEAVLQALARLATARGKRVRIAFDNSGAQPPNPFVDPKPGTTADQIRTHGLEAVATPVHLGGFHIMHDKFAIRDARDVWTGSANFTTGGLTLQDNQCVVLRSAAAARLYQPVFDALISTTPAPSTLKSVKPLSFGSSKVSLYFAPGAGEGIDQVCKTLIGGARKVLLMAFVLTDPDILGALAAFKPARADFRAIIDPEAKRTLKKATTLDPALLWWATDPRVRVAHSHPFSLQRENDFQHNKVLIVDGRQVVCGSYNLSENAEANDENLLLIDSQPIASAYSAYFDAVYATGSPAG